MRTGVIDRLYVHSPDRPARKYAYQVLLVEEFSRLGVEVVFFNRELGRSPEDDLLLQVQGMMAEYERAKIMERNRRGKLHATLKTLLVQVPPSSLRPGDVLVTNDPWIGNGHLPDVFVITPAFRRDSVVGFVVSIVHHMDFGGRLSTPESREIYEEGLRLPPQKLYKEGRENSELFEIIRWNVRLLEKVIGDLRDSGVGRGKKAGERCAALGQASANPPGVVCP